MKAIAEAKVKTDKIDSETLAHLLRVGLLLESYVPPRDIRELRDLVRRRAFLVGMLTKLKNRAHAELAKRGIDLGVPLFTREELGILRSLRLEAVEQLLPVVESLDKQINPISGSLKRMSGEDPRAARAEPPFGRINWDEVDRNQLLPYLRAQVKTHLSDKPALILRLSNL